MKKATGNKIRLGLFVTGGIFLLMAALYMIGSRRNIFSDTVKVTGDFYNVDGLMVGHNVRFCGIDVGTVDEIEFVNDSSVRVTMLISQDMQKHIRSNAIASIGTDGLMGNKLVSISPRGGTAAYIKDNDALETLRPVETGEMIRTLKVTNDNLAAITDDLRTITEKVNTRNTLWSLLLDTAVAENVKQAIVDIRITGRNSAVVTGDLSRIVNGIREGKGSVGAIISDTTLYGQVKQTIVDIKLAGERTAIITGNLDSLIGSVRKGEGSIGALIMDTSFAHKINKTLDNLEDGSDNFNQNMEALKQSFLLRKYFRKQAKQQPPK
ncbi:MAG: putative ABC transport system substrate-binding protein [Bacteroidetes bacterium]|nr:MAG: putative ABC transport system substrate-binding protein [Bacteroidota bacterium]